jgi:hypothetical protein
MPKKFEDLGLSFLYPDNWTSSEDPTAQACMLESPEGAFLTITRLEGSDVVDPVAQAKAAMEKEYQDIEVEPISRTIANRELTGVTQRFVYLDLIITSHLLAFAGNGCTYLVQIQAEDRDMNRLEQVFEAILTSLCQSLTT